MPAVQTPFEQEVKAFLGQNTAQNPAELAWGAQALAKNAVMREIGTIGKRDGSRPVTTTALGATVEHLAAYQFDNSVTVGGAPTLAAVGDAASTLPAGTYYVRYTFVTDNGESQASAEASQVIASGEKLRVTVPAVPYHANQTNVYISTTTNAEKLEGNTITTTFDRSVPLTGTVAYPTVNTTAFESELLAASGTSLYSHYNNKLNPATMTNALTTADIYTEAFTNSLLTSRFLIADTASLKAYNGSTVANVPPAPNDTAPLPANVLTDINVKGCKFIWVYSGHVFLSPGTNEMFYSKRYEFDYVPEVQYFYLVRDNDYINGCGIAFNNVCLIPMRWGFAMLTGTNFDNFAASTFLNTLNGVIAPRSVVKITYPNGAQTVAYLSDDGVNEIFDTGAIDTGVRQYSSRSLMSDKIDFNGVGFTEAEMSLARMEFDGSSNLLKLWITRGSIYYCYVMDVRDGEWRVWIFPWNVKPSLRYEGISYFTGSTGHLHKLDENLYTDWNESSMSTVGTAVDFDVYSGLLSFEFSGHASYLDYLLIEAKQWTVPSKLDVTLIYGASYTEIPSALRNEIMTWASSAYAEAEWANLDFTDIVNNAKRLIFKRKGKYFQRRMRNNRDEPVLIYKERYQGRLSNK